MVLFGALAALDVAWSLADVTMGLMALCNLIAISLLGKYAFKLLEATVHRNGRVSKTLFSQKTASKR